MAGLAFKTLADILTPQAKTQLDMSQLGAKLSAMLNGSQEESQACLLAIKKTDRQFSQKMRALDINLEELAGRIKTHKRRAKIAPNDIMPQILGGCVMIGFFFMVGFVLQGGLQGLEADGLTLIGTLIGYVSAKADQVIAFFFGSSSGSREKTRALTRAVDGLPSADAP